MLNSDIFADPDRYETAFLSTIQSSISLTTARAECESRHHGSGQSINCSGMRYAEVRICEYVDMRSISQTDPSDEPESKICRHLMHKLDEIYYLSRRLRPTLDRVVVCPGSAHTRAQCPKYCKSQPYILQRPKHRQYDGGGI
jgi:hypothetical protein